MTPTGGTLWTPTATDGTPEDIAVLYLLSVPALIVDLLREQGQAQTPYEVLRTIDEYLPNNLGGEPNRHPTEQEQTEPRYHPRNY